jgi:hypothetical protein
MVEEKQKDIENLRNPENPENLRNLRNPENPENPENLRNKKYLHNFIFFIFILLNFSNFLLEISMLPLAPHCHKYILHHLLSSLILITYFHYLEMFSIFSFPL